MRPRDDGARFQKYLHRRHGKPNCGIAGAVGYLHVQVDAATVYDGRERGEPQLASALFVGEARVQKSRVACDTNTRRYLQQVT